MGFSLVKGPFPKFLYTCCFWSHAAIYCKSYPYLTYLRAEQRYHLFTWYPAARPQMCAEITQCLNLPAERREIIQEKSSSKKPFWSENNVFYFLKSGSENRSGLFFQGRIFMCQPACFFVVVFIGEFIKPLKVEADNSLWSFIWTPVREDLQVNKRKLCE